jgi:thioredoxin 1
MSVIITKENTDDIFGQQDKLLVVDFWASWCKPCNILGPVIDELATEFEDKAVVAKVNVDENKEIANKYGIRNIPTILFIRNGEVIDKQMGVSPKNILKSKIEQHLL